MNIAVRGIGIISALGNGAGETLAALRAGRSGIGKPTLFRSAVDVPVGEVRRDNRALGELLGIPARETPSRTALLGMIAAAQAVADAQKQAAEIRAADEKRLAAGKAQVDAALAAEKQAQAKALDEEFLRAKHALDGRFDANRSAWLDGLCKDLFEA